MGLDAESPLTRGSERESSQTFLQEPPTSIPRVTKKESVEGTHNPSAPVREETLQCRYTGVLWLRITPVGLTVERIVTYP